MLCKFPSAGFKWRGSLLKRLAAKTILTGCSVLQHHWLASHWPPSHRQCHNTSYFILSLTPARAVRSPTESRLADWQTGRLAPPSHLPARWRLTDTARPHYGAVLSLRTGQDTHDHCAAHTTSSNTGHRGILSDFRDIFWRVVKDSLFAIWIWLKVPPPREWGAQHRNGYLLPACPPSGKGNKVVLCGTLAEPLVLAGLRPGSHGCWHTPDLPGPATLIWTTFWTTSETWSSKKSVPPCW